MCNVSNTLNDIKSGAAFGNAITSLSSIGTMASNLPSEAAAALSAMQANIAIQMESAMKNISRDISIAAASLDLKNTFSQTTGNTGISSADISAALGPLAMLKDGPEMLKSATTKIANNISSFGTKFGADISSFKGNLIASAKSAGNAAAEFFNTVPPETIPDPFNPLLQIPNPAYAEFIANKDNASKLGSLSNLTSKVSSLASDLSASVNELEQKANVALSNGIADLKAMALAAKLANPLPDIIASSMKRVVDATKFDGNCIAAKVDSVKPLSTTTISSIK